MKEEVFKVALETGLHARPAGILVKAAGAFKSRISFRLTAELLQQKV